MKIQVNKKVRERQREGLFDPFGAIYGTLRLGLGQEKWSDIHWESHLVKKFDLIKEAPMAG